MTDKDKPRSKLRTLGGLTERHRFQRGSYVQPAFTRSDVKVLIWVGAAQALGRGYDYATPEQKTGAPPSIELIEQSYPLVVWGVYFILSVVILIFNLLQKRHLFVWLGHVLLFTGYGLLFLSISMPLLFKYPLGEVRAMTVLLIPLTIHWILSIRTGPRPIRTDNIVSMEGVGGEQT